MATPSRQLAVLTVLLDVLVEREVGPTTPLKVIVNDDSEPDQIYVVIGPEVALGR